MAHSSSPQDLSQFSLEDMISNHWIFCDSLRNQKILEKSKGKEMIFTDSQPSWILENLPESPPEPPEKDDSDEKREQEKQRVLKIQKKRECLKQKRKEETKLLPDNLLIHKLVKGGLSKTDAIQKLVEERRASAQVVQKNESTSSSSKMKQCDASEVPWKPSLPNNLQNMFSKILTPVEHQRYVAIATNFINPNPQTRFLHNKKELEIMDGKLKEEREVFQKRVFNSIKKNRNPIFFCCDHAAMDYIIARHNARLYQTTGHFGRHILKVDPNKMIDSNKTVLFRKSVLYPGRPPNITIPNERKRYEFPHNVEEICNNYPSSSANQYPIEKDELALEFAIANRIPIVMSSSAAILIMTKSWLSNFSDFCIPVNVRRHFDENLGQFINICFVGKPCASKMNHPSVWRRYLKYCVKMAISPNTKGSSKKRHRTENESNYDDVIRKRSRADTEEDNKNLTVDEESLSGTSNIPLQNKNESLQDDLLCSILSQMGSLPTMENKLNYSINDKANKNLDKRKQYNIFCFEQNRLGTANVLIRSNHDGVDCNGNNLAIIPKAEYLPDYGAEKISDEEWLHDYLKCRFKCASQLLRIRIHAKKFFYLQRERYNESSLTANRPGSRNIVEERTLYMKSVLDSLINLEVGSYLLCKNDANEVEIYPKLDELSNGSFMDRTNIESVQIDKQLPDLETLFQGIDEHLVLVYHILLKRIPATLPRQREESNDKKSNSVSNTNDKNLNKKRRSRPNRCRNRNKVNKISNSSST